MLALRHYTTTRNIREPQHSRPVIFYHNHYTTTRNIRELQHNLPTSVHVHYYTTTRNIRELQQTPQVPIRIPDYTITRNIRELQLARRGCPGRSHYSPPLSAISIPTAPPLWLPSIPWAGAKSANCTANYKISRRAFPPAGARFFFFFLKLQKTKKRTEINDFSSISVLFGAEGGI